jgi:hypothetical protein
MAKYCLNLIKYYKGKCREFTDRALTGSPSCVRSSACIHGCGEAGYRYALLEKMLSKAFGPGIMGLLFR